MWSVVDGRRSVVSGLATVIWSVVGCCSGRWLNNRNLVGGRLLFWSVVGFFTAIGRWSVVFQIGGRWFLWSVVGYFLGKWSVVPGRWSVSLWSVAGRWAVVLYYAQKYKIKSKIAFKVDHESYHCAFLLRIKII